MKTNQSILPPLPLNISWEIIVISFLMIAVQARAARIKRLEELNHQMAVELDSVYAERRRAA